MQKIQLEVGIIFLKKCLALLILLANNKSKLKLFHSSIKKVFHQKNGHRHSICFLKRNSFLKNYEIYQIEKRQSVRNA